MNASSDKTWDWRGLRTAAGWAPGHGDGTEGKQSNLMLAEAELEALLAVRTVCPKRHVRLIGLAPTYTDLHSGCGT